MKQDFQITYFLWKARKDKAGLMPLYLRSKQNSVKQIMHNTGVKLSKQQWNEKKGEPRNKSAELLDLERDLKATYRDLVRQGHEPNLQMIVKNRTSIKKPTDNNIMAWCDDYIRGDYSDGMKKAVGTIKTNIKEFNAGLSFDSLTKPKLKAFFEHLTKEGVANNSQYKRLRALINVCNHADAHCPALDNYEMPYETKNSIKTRLTWPEVKAAMNTATESTIERVALDAFLIACFAGLRISDILTLNKGELHPYYYERIQTKTKTPVMVTVHKYNEELLKRYIDSGISYSRQKLSAALKDVLERSGLTKEITRIQQVGNKHKETVKQKYEDIAFHSGRRFYSRLLNDLGLGSEITRDELGHGYRSVTELYAGSPDHTYRVARVRKAMESMEATMEELALMKVA